MFTNAMKFQTLNFNNTRYVYILYQINQFFKQSFDQNKWRCDPIYEQVRYNDSLAHTGLGLSKSLPPVGFNDAFSFKNRIADSYIKRTFQGSR